MKSTQFLAGAALLTLLFPAARAHAQVEQGGSGFGGGICDALVHRACDGQDDFSHSTSGGGIAANRHSDEPDCYLCMSGATEVDPSNCHGACTHNLNESELAAYNKVLKAGYLGDVTEVIKDARVAPNLVVFNVARASVQILSCDGRQVIANLPVSGVTLRLAAALPARGGTAVVSVAANGTR